MNRAQAYAFMKAMNNWKEYQAKRASERAERSAANAKVCIASIDKGGKHIRRFSKQAETDNRVRIFHKARRAYTPMNMSELLVWEFMCLKPETADLHNRPLITRRGFVDRDLSFVEAYERAYM